MTEPPVDIVDRFPEPQRALVIEVDDDFCTHAAPPACRLACTRSCPMVARSRFCKHHGDQHFEALIEKGARIADHRRWDET